MTKTVHRTSYDAVIIGAGVFGVCLALALRRHLGRVLLVEGEGGILQRASYNNQARVHNGYHYPRSLLTALRSRVNFGKFTTDFNDCIVNSFDKYYAIGHRFSKVSAEQFKVFCQRIGAPLRPAPAKIKSLFDKGHIEDVFSVEEYAFDAVRLKNHLCADIERSGIELHLNSRADRVTPADGGCIAVALCGPEGEYRVSATYVFNCTYSRINTLLAASALPVIPLKHELTEIALIELPEALHGMAVTVMCGPFFSIMPFPPKGQHTLSHVRYTPHHHWEDSEQNPVMNDEARFRPPRSNYTHMIKDAQRYLPALREARHVDSLWEVKTVLPSSEVDDSRPILFRRHHGIKNLFCILGGKVDNIYDMLEEIAEIDWR